MIFGTTEHFHKYGVQNDPKLIHSKGDKLVTTIDDQTDKVLYMLCYLNNLKICQSEHKLSKAMSPEYGIKPGHIYR